MTNTQPKAEPAQREALLKVLGELDALEEEFPEILELPLDPVDLQDED